MNNGRVGVQISLVGSALALCLLAACLLNPRPASAASTCPGPNGQIAVVTVPEQRPSAPSVGIVESISRSSRSIAHRCFPKAFPLTLPSRATAARSCTSKLKNIPFLRASGYRPNLEGRRSKLHTPHLCSYVPAFLSNGRVIFNGYSVAAHPGSEGATYGASATVIHLRRLFSGAEQACTVNGRMFVSGRGSNNVLFLLNAKARSSTASLLPWLKAGQYGPASISPNGRWVVYQKESFSHGHGLNQNDLYLVRQ